MHLAALLSLEVKNSFPPKEILQANLGNFMPSTHVQRPFLRLTVALYTFGIPRSNPGNFLAETMIKLTSRDGNSGNFPVARGHCILQVLFAEFPMSL